MPLLTRHLQASPQELYELSQAAFRHLLADKGPLQALAAGEPRLCELAPGSFVFFTRLWPDVVLPVEREGCLRDAHA